LTDIVIVAAARTAVGKFGGALAKTPASELGAVVIKDLLRRTGLSGDQISEVILGQVLTAGCGQNPARQAVIKAGLPHGVPAMTINKVCGSGLKAVMLGAQAIRDGDAEIVIAGGQESMSSSPHVLPNSRDGQRMGNWQMVDTMINDGLWDVYNQYHMGITAENVAKQYGITREEQDALALASSAKGSCGTGRWQVQGRNRSRGDPAEEGRSAGGGHRRVPQPQVQCRSPGWPAPCL
jgi:acetyl-CoA C-acetyltransferase